jgi:dGTPase
VYSDETYNKKMLLLPPEYRQGSSKEARLRNVADYIGGMMDSFAVQEYEGYFGKGELDRSLPR